jgi:hypothetical protein
MQKILVFNGNQPCLDIQSDGTGVNRDRNPDAGWDELRASNMKYAKEQELTEELKIILIEDLAYFLGKHSNKFTVKLREFNLI